MTKACLWCKKDYEAKRETSKYCSTSCRVMFNRKPAVKGSISKLDMVALYNEFKAAILEIPNMRHVPMVSEKELLTAYNASNPNQFISVETKPAPIKIIRSAEQWHELKRACESAEEWATVKYQIENAPNLSTKQKQLIFNTQ